MSNMSVSLPEQMKAWIEARIKAGKYHNASEYVRDLIRRDQGDHEKLEVLRAAIDKGRKSGVSDKSIDDIWREVKSRFDD